MKCARLNGVNAARAIGPWIGDESRLDLCRVEERGDVGESDDHFRSLPERGEVDPVEDAGHAVAPTEAPDRIDLGIREGGVEVAESLFVRAREVAVVPMGVRGEPGLEAQRTAEVFSARQVVVLEHRAGGSHQRHAASGAQRRRPDEIL